MPELKPCPDCGAPCSTRADRCPKCGRRRPHPNPVIGPALGIGCLVFVVVIALCLGFYWLYQ